MNATRGIILAAMMFPALFSGCDSLQNALNLQKPNASLKGLKLDNISLESANLLFDVEIANPYPVALPLVNVDYGVTSNANKLFSGKADLEGTVPAKSTKMVSLPAKISYLDVVNAFKGIRPGSKIPYQADVGLSVDAPALGVIRLPLNKTGELSVPTIPKLGEIGTMILDKVNNP
jgi:LEA14-like dessication related protein